jgi:hypothetical protein
VLRAFDLEIIRDIREKSGEPVGLALGKGEKTLHITYADGM